MGRINRKTINVHEVSPEEKIQAIDEPKRSDSQIEVKLSNDTIALFREVVLEDIIAIQKANVIDEIEAAVRISARCCVKFGDKPGVTPIQIERLPARDLNKIGNALGTQADVASSVKERIETTEDYTTYVILFDGTEATFRDATVGDIKQARAKSKNLLEQSAHLAALLCTKWGDKESISYEKVVQINYSNFQLIGKALENFFR